MPRPLLQLRKGLDNMAGLIIIPLALLWIAFECAREANKEQQKSDWDKLFDESEK